MSGVWSQRSCGMCYMCWIGAVCGCDIGEPGHNRQSSLPRFVFLTLCWILIFLAHFVVKALTPRHEFLQDAAGLETICASGAEAEVIFETISTILFFCRSAILSFRLGYCNAVSFPMYLCILVGRCLIFFPKQVLSVASITNFFLPKAMHGLSCSCRTSFWALEWFYDMLVQFARI